MVDATNDLIKLYSGRILELASDIGCTERLSDPDATASARAPTCGSSLTVDVKLEDGRIAAFGQDVKACALGQAAASVVARNVIGATPAQISEARASLRAMLTDNGPAPADPFAELDVLRAAAGFSNRHASIQLCLEALEDACRKASQAA